MKINLVCIETFGCQMNDRDSEIMEQLLAEAGYSRGFEPASADLVVINTCSIRGKAEQKAMSLLGMLKKTKAQNPAMIIAVAGCVAQQEGHGLLRRMPHIDLVVGPRSIHQIPDLVERVKREKSRVVAIEQDDCFEIPALLPSPPVTAARSYRRFVTIMQGCNNFCTYCVVPFTRGREISRSPMDILTEVNHLIAQGVKEVTLLGQNVNSYGLDHRADRDNFPDFPALLRMVAKVPGLERLRFTTSNPKDLSESLMTCFAELPNLCPHFHLPVQSGSDRILRKMNRKYSIDTYLAKVAGLRKSCPKISLTTDIIVGFPGETDGDFAATMTLLEEVRFHGAYSFKYSDRPHTVSAGFTDKVPEEVKSRRLKQLQSRQTEITLERNGEYIGRKLEVLVEGESHSGNGQLSGRTADNMIVNFTAGGYANGTRLVVEIEEACLHSLRGRLIENKEDNIND